MFILLATQSVESNLYNIGSIVVEDNVTIEDL